MAAFIFFVVLVAILAAAGIASALGLTPDTRDPAYGVGPVFAPRSHKRAASKLATR